ncbi:uncharacterized protein TNIN_384751 [Trichonephila inaurata madagascariensis]|uniref:Uncharacterized protein n=1 Tax=Trichonephila inaurata madagascariensis TaxID=2747483 RepID=A0A8X7CJW3_9ARAC|nr:uncharacterized protein TNIN_384751 [Trichonephila inaurata madagascariensis]
MCTLKEIILVKCVDQFINDFKIRSLVKRVKAEIWKKAIRRKLSAFDIPFTLKGEIIVLMKPMALEIDLWRENHIGICSTRQERSRKFRFHADGMVDRIKTADSLIHSKRLCEETRFVLACQYWSSCDHEVNVSKWIDHYRAGSNFGSQPWDDITDASLQSRRLNDLSQEDCKSLLHEVFEDTDKMHLGRFCLSRMSADYREQLLTLFPVKVLRIYLFRVYHQFFMGAANKDWNRLPRKHFTGLLHIINCQKILELWEDFDYEDLLRQFWRRSPDHLKHYVEGKDIFEIMIEIVKNGFHPKNVPRYFYLHDKCFEDNAIICNDITKKL